eukprot:gnl/TRDRNA2_/TRDRNA2_199691_c0_seq1.p1 gnl/TRDRNA2_/TRDRNA2_199691_c0~~gnl/TRDRNA2_/TRDRNA2_199691_c0_seq1.p1  ORF type:complete len:277 (+),score=30.70 gnl/TRDRNA2_/TRDRNA2_199691_c0_seq1:76-906(+)
MLDLSGKANVQTTSTSVGAETVGLVDLSLSGSRRQPTLDHSSAGHARSSPLKSAAPSPSSCRPVPTTTGATSAVGTIAGSEGQQDRKAAARGDGLLSIVCTQTECCLRLLALGMEAVSEVPGLFRECKGGSVFALRAGFLADVICGLVACMGVIALGEHGNSATAHIVNLLVLALTAMVMIVEAYETLPQLGMLTAARTLLLDRVGFLSELHVLAVLHLAQGSFALAIWYDHSLQSYAAGWLVALLAGVVQFMCAPLSGDIDTGVHQRASGTNAVV